jgi:RNA 2',3'-cyclic 3'-phosphodiesterase
VTSSDTVEGSERLRLFCALTLPEPVLDRIVDWQRHVLPLDVRFVPRENLHVTVAFLGSRPAGDVDRVAAELAAAAADAVPMRLSLHGYRETRSVGMLTFDDLGEHASRFASDVFTRLERIGVYEREQRRWLPHVTVVRFRQAPHLHPSLPELGEVVPSDAAVYLSRLRSGGAEYVVLESFALGG